MEKKTNPKLIAAITLVVFLFIFAWQKFLSQKTTEIARPTFNATADELIDVWNTRAIDFGDKSFILPTSKLWKDAGKNGRFHAISYQLKPTVQLSIEIDNQSNRAFSLSMIGGPTNPQDQNDNVIAMIAIASTVYGKKENADAIGDACNGAREEPKKVRIGSFDVYCGYAMGALVTGISVPNT